MGLIRCSSVLVEWGTGWRVVVTRVWFRKGLVEGKSDNFGNHLICKSTLSCYFHMGSLFSMYLFSIIKAMLCPIKKDSNTIELTVHTSCYYTNSVLLFTSHDTI